MIPLRPVWFGASPRIHERADGRTDTQIWRWNSYMWYTGSRAKLYPGTKKRLCLTKPSNFEKVVFYIQTNWKTVTGNDNGPRTVCYVLTHKKRVPCLRNQVGYTYYISKVTSNDNYILTYVNIMYFQFFNNNVNGVASLLYIYSLNLRMDWISTIGSKKYLLLDSIITTKWSK